MVDDRTRPVSDARFGNERYGAQNLFVPHQAHVPDPRFAEHASAGGGRVDRRAFGQQAQFGWAPCAECKMFLKSVSVVDNGIESGILTCSYASGRGA